MYLPTVNSSTPQTTTRSFGSKMSSTLTNSDSRHSTLEPGKTDYEAAEQANPRNTSYETQNNVGAWSAVLVNKPDGTSQNPHLKITVEIPLLDLLSSAPTERVAYPNGVNENTGHTGLLHKRSLYEMDRVVSDYQSLEPNYVRRNVKHNTLPHQYRSTIFKAVGQAASEPEHAQTLSLDSSTSKSYLAAMTDLDRMLEGNTDWKKVEELEQTVWLAQSDPNCPTFIRQVSVLSFTLNGYNSGQKMAHFRLLAADTTNEITLVDKNLTTAKFFAADSSETEQLQNRRFPLITPTRVRERYARQVRVVTEILTMMEDLLESVKNADEKYTATFLSEN
ncbi:hypothetical protein PHET_02631 [Paragonimus heterotremus]|uniref:Uncharacterized protein n=1 Tax=Paragonimus heterotremus TaxID=100268 RepID=A0A8J4SQH5_9TREM|nr:hypothetical protein PHET_02631 [Paragonimus heterotremus]